jgi:hypothetical protein
MNSVEKLKPFKCSKRLRVIYESWLVKIGYLLWPRWQSDHIQNAQYQHQYASLSTSKFF